MVYRHIYWGLLQIGPSKDKLMTKAVKKRKYLVKITTPRKYSTKEEAREDDFEYDFNVWSGGEVSLFGASKAIQERLAAGEELPDGVFSGYDEITQDNWPRYQLIRLKADADISPSGIRDCLCRCGVPSGKRWEKLFPVYGSYPVRKVAYSIVAFPEVDGEDKGG